MKKTENKLVLSDDLDSLFSCIVLNQLFGLEIGGFYNFKSINFIDKDNMAAKGFIGVDADLNNSIKCFGNHVTQLSSTDIINPNTANINLVNNISGDNYFEKFAGSTLMQILSLYDVDIDTFTDEQKMVIAVIDGFYIPFDVKFRDFRPRQREYLKQLEQENFGKFIECVMKEKGVQAFKDIADKYKLNGKINLEFGILDTNIDLEGLSKLFDMPFLLPKSQFKQYKRYNIKYVKHNNLKDKEQLRAQIKAGNLLSMAMTYKNSIVASYR